MMKIWLIVFLIGSDGEMLDKKEVTHNSYEQCMIAAAKEQLRMVNTGTGVITFCVTDDHHSGKKADKGVPMDF